MIFCFCCVFFYGFPVLRTSIWSGMKAVTAPHCRTAVSGHFGHKPLRPGTPDRPKSICFNGAPRAGLHSLAIILTLALVSKLKRTVSECCNQIIARECYTQKNCEGVSKFKEMPVSQSNKLPWSIRNKSTVKMYNNHKECM